METIMPRVRVSYRIAVDRIPRHIGATQLQTLTPLQVETLYTTLPTPRSLHHAPGARRLGRLADRPEGRSQLPHRPQERLSMAFVLLATPGGRAVRTRR